METRSKVYERVREKKESYRRYNFERLQEEAFATFFDLAQEYTSVESLYQICVAVPKEFFGLESRLYIICPSCSQLEKVCTSTEGLIPETERRQVSIEISEDVVETEEACLFPIRGNQALTEWIPFQRQSRILGMFEIYPKEKLNEKENFFFEKFTNRIGYNLHQKLLIEQNIAHIKFINQLVADIEHNVISPNMYYKLFLIRLRKAISTYIQTEQKLKSTIGLIQDQNPSIASRLSEILQGLTKNTERLEGEAMAFSKHYEHTSLSIETLFRRDHFEKGTYVLRKQPCNFRTEIIEPLLERYLPMLERKGIAVDNRLENVPDDEITLFVDKGLISQVFDNFFSNALKYAHEVKDQMGHKTKFLSYNREIIKDFFGKDVHGVRFSFFTTGAPLSTEEAERVFEEGYRASNSGGERGGGHGLHFVKNVVEIHGGTVGCEPQPHGNLLYFVLPLRSNGS